MIQTPYLQVPIEDFHQITLEVDFGSGNGRIICDPNTCSLGPFGDRQICTLIAPQSSDVVLTPLRISDPAGHGRRLYGIAGHPLRNELNLVAPAGNTGDFRLIYTQRNGQRRVVSTEPVGNPSYCNGDEDLVCTPLGRIVDSDSAEAMLHPGIVNDTWFLTVVGKKPYLNTLVRIRPRVYSKQPEYWGFDVVTCRRGDFDLPAIGTYTETLDVTEQLGLRGVEVFWAEGNSQKIDLKG